MALVSTRTRLLIGMGSALLLAGCSGMSAAQVGQTAGTIAGSAIAPGIGTTLGALVGTVAGLVVDHHVDKVREQQERVELGQQLSTATPASATNTEATPGEPTRVWVDEHLKDGRVLAGHFEVRDIP